MNTPRKKLTGSVSAIVCENYDTSGRYISLILVPLINVRHIALRRNIMKLKLCPLLTFILALAFGGCAHTPSKSEIRETAARSVSSYIHALERYAGNKAKTSEVIANLQDIAPISDNEEFALLKDLDICRLGFSEGLVQTLELNHCQAKLSDYFTLSADAEDRGYGSPAELIAAYFAAVREPEASQERVTLKDRAVESVEGMPPLPDINIRRSRYSLLLRLLQAQTGKPAGVSLPEDINRKSAAWLAVEKE